MSELKGRRGDDKRENLYHNWSADEEAKLREGVNVVGKNWTQLQLLYLPNLQPIQIKNKYYTLVRRTSFSESSSATSEIETSVSSVSIMSQQQTVKEEPRPADRPKPKNADDWLNFTVFDHPDFLSFDDFAK